MLIVYHKKQPTVIKQSSVINCLLQSVTSTTYVINIIHITMSDHFILGYVVRRLVIIINNQVVRKIKIAVENDVKNWAYISLR